MSNNREKGQKAQSKKKSGISWNSNRRLPCENNRELEHNSSLWQGFFKLFIAIQYTYLPGISSNARSLKFIDMYPPDQF